MNMIRLPSFELATWGSLQRLDMNWHFHLYPAYLMQVRCNPNVEGSGFIWKRDTNNPNNLNSCTCSPVNGAVERECACSPYLEESRRWWSLIYKLYDFLWQNSFWSRILRISTAGFCNINCANSATIRVFQNTVLPVCKQFKTFCEFHDLSMSNCHFAFICVHLLPSLHQG